eukprot:GILK01010980.1.p1 GENE.GILK01010980.1~~GILK01010980.1.p1  ORF type:complete len:1243 (+),score=229.20 GILK01010980.1:96-3824(+)
MDFDDFHLDDELRTSNLTLTARKAILAPTSRGFLPVYRETQEERAQNAVRSRRKNKGWQREGATRRTFMTEIDERRKTVKAQRKKHEPDDELLSIQDIMTLLDSNKLSAIKRDFKADGDALSQQQFIQVMLKHLNGVTKPVALVASLTELFDQLDVNGDQTMEWEELSSFIVESGMVRKDQFLVDSIKHYIPSPLRDVSKHETEVDRVRYLPGLDRFVSLERDSRKFKVYDPRNAHLLGDVSGHRGAVLDVEHITDYEFIATCSNDLTIAFWDPVTFNLRQRLSTADLQICLQWSPQHKVLYSGTVDGNIRRWDVDNLCEYKPASSVNAAQSANPLFSNRPMHCHTGPVMDLLTIPSLDILASASMDAKICLWDMSTNQFRKELIGHKKGVYSLAYTADYHCLFSAGLDHDALVWNPYVERMIYRLKGHSHSLIGVQIVPGTPQIITGDVSGVFKVWDMRNFGCVHSFGEPSSSHEATCFASIHHHKRIVVGGRRLQFFEYDEPNDLNVTDQHSVTACLYNSVFLTFITAHRREIKLWNAQTGCLQSVFNDLSVGDITAVCMDQRQRKLFVGDSQGGVCCLNLVNGAVMKRFSPHATDVSCIAYWQHAKRLVSVAWNATVHIHEEENELSSLSTIKMEMRHHAEDCTGCALSNELEVMATCSVDGNVMVYDLRTLRLDGVCKHAPGTQIMGIKILDPYPALISVDQSGFLYLWGIKPFLHRYSCFLEYLNVDSRNGQPTPIRCISFDPILRYLFIGDEHGFVKVFNIGPVLDQLDMIPGSRKPKRAAVSAPARVDHDSTVNQGSRRLNTVRYVTEEPDRVIDPNEFKRLGTASFLAKSAVESANVINLTNQNNKIVEQENNSNHKSSRPHKIDSPIPTVGGEIDSNHMPVQKESSPFIYEQNGEVNQFGPLTVSTDFPALPVEPLADRTGKRTAKHLNTRIGVRIEGIPFPGQFNLSEVEEGDKEKVEALIHDLVLADPTSPRRRTSRGLTRPNKIRSEDVEMLREWQAHNDSVTVLELISEPSAVITCSYERVVTVWSRTGEPLGNLLQGGDNGWKLPIDIQYRRLQQMQKAEQLLQELEDSGKLVLSPVNVSPKNPFSLINSSDSVSDISHLSDHATRARFPPLKLGEGRKDAPFSFYSPRQHASSQTPRERAFPLSKAERQAAGKLGEAMQTLGPEEGLGFLDLESPTRKVLFSNGFSRPVPPPKSAPALLSARRHEKHNRSKRLAPKSPRGSPEEVTS